MVHALKEVHRILVPQGIMIDVRPLCVDVPLEFVHAGGSESAGLMDLSPDIESDIAADKAVDCVIKESLYHESGLEYFDFVFYWKTLKGMEEHIEENWKAYMVIPEQVRQRARILYHQRRPQTRIRIGWRMKLGIYGKR